MKPVLSVQNLQIAFQNEYNETVSVLQDIHFDIAAGSTLALIGASGSGKSICSLAIMKLLPKTAKVSGSILLNDTELLSLDTTSWNIVSGNDISMIFQEPMSALNPIMTCGKQLVECITTHQNKTYKEAKALAIQWLDKVQLPNPNILFERYPHQISGGQKQRLMIAMALCNHPKVLIADEPTTALDVIVQKDIIALMKSLQKEMNTAIIFITHDMGLAKLIADEVLVLENGRIAANQTFLTKTIKTTAGSNTDIDEQPLLSVQDIEVVFKDTRGFFKSKSLQTIKAVDKVSFDIHKATTLGLVGGSGCGKSTVSKCILGLQAIESGAIYFEDKRIDNQYSKNFPDYRKSIQMVFQDPYASLNPRITVKDVLTEVIHIHKICSKHTIESYINSLLDKVGLPISAKYKYPHEFSGGQRQRICIARALAVQPKLIVCDESVAALDVKMQQQILELLMQLQEEMQLSYLFISHDLKLVEQISNHIIVMQSGKIVEANDTKSLMQLPQHAYTKELIAAIV